MWSVHDAPLTWLIYAYLLYIGGATGIGIACGYYCGKKVAKEEHLKSIDQKAKERGEKERQK